MSRTEIKPDKSKIRLRKLDQGAERFADKSAYEKRLKTLQEEMLHIQQTYWHEKRRAVLVFEGWDAAGKGGAIRRITEQLDPRGFHVWPIARRPPPSRAALSVALLAADAGAGHLRDLRPLWYGRVLVERVEGFAKPREWKRAYDEINEFERLLIDDGARIVKLFFHITEDEQLSRFRERLTNP